MSTMPWGTMNDWLRIEAEGRFESERRGAWRQQRVQDLRAAQVVASVPVRTRRVRRATPASPACA